MINIKFIENARDLSIPKHQGLDNKYKQKRKEVLSTFFEWTNNLTFCQNIDQEKNEEY